VQTARPMAGRATKVSDAAPGGMDILVIETNDGLGGYRKVDVELTPLTGGGLRIEAEVPASPPGRSAHSSRRLGVKAG